MSIVMDEVIKRWMARQKSALVLEDHPGQDDGGKPAGYVQPPTLRQKESRAETRRDHGAVGRTRDRFAKLRTTRYP